MSTRGGRRFRPVSPVREERNVPGFPIEQFLTSTGGLSVAPFKSGEVAAEVRVSQDMNKLSLPSAEEEDQQISIGKKNGLFSHLGYAVGLIHKALDYDLDKLDSELGGQFYEAVMAISSYLLEIGKVSEDSSPVVLRQQSGGLPRQHSGESPRQQSGQSGRSSDPSGRSSGRQDHNNVGHDGISDYFLFRQQFDYEQAQFQSSLFMKHHGSYIRALGKHNVGTLEHYYSLTTYIASHSLPFAPAVVAALQSVAPVLLQKIFDSQLQAMDKRAVGRIDIANVVGLARIDPLILHKLIVFTIIGDTHACFRNILDVRLSSVMNVDEFFLKIRMLVWACPFPFWFIRDSLYRSIGLKDPSYLESHFKYRIGAYPFRLDHLFEVARHHVNVSGTASTAPALASNGSVPNSTVLLSSKQRSGNKIHSDDDLDPDGCWSCQRAGRPFKHDFKQCRIERRSNSFQDRTRVRSNYSKPGNSSFAKKRGYFKPSTKRSHSHGSFNRKKSRTAFLTTLADVDGKVELGVLEAVDRFEDSITQIPAENDFTLDYDAQQGIGDDHVNDFDGDNDVNHSPHSPYSFH
jgi:hypothetical protein